VIMAEVAVEATLIWQKSCVKCQCLEASFLVLLHLYGILCLDWRCSFARDGEVGAAEVD